MSVHDIKHVHGPLKYKLRPKASMVGEGFLLVLGELVFMLGLRNREAFY